MERRALIILLGTLIAVIGVFYFTAPTDTMVEHGNESIVFPPGVDVQGKGLTFLRAGPEGQMQISAQRGFGVRESNEAILVGVRILLQGADGRRGELQAKRCVLPADSKTVALSGGVEARTEDGFTITTPHFDFDWERNVAETEAPVKVEGPGIVVRGIGGEITWVDGAITIRKDVRATIRPDRLPPDVLKAVPQVKGPRP